LNNNITDNLNKRKNWKTLEVYKKTKVGILPNDWNVLPIEELVERIRKPVKVELNKMYRQIGIRSHGKGIFYKDEVSGFELGNKAVFWIEPKCFIVNIVFAWELAVAKTTQNEIGMIASHRFPMYKPLINMLNLDYLTYFFKSNMGKHLLELASPGGAGRNKTLSQKGFFDLLIPIPRINEQEKIAEILSTWDKSIELKEKLIEKNKNQTRGLMRTLLTGEVRLQGFGGEWREVRLGDICNITTGKLDANAAVENGKYKFFTCSKTDYLIDKYAFDTEALIIAGNGDIGHIKYFNGKFNAYQRTYVLDKFLGDTLYIKNYMDYKFKMKVDIEKQAGAMPYIKIDTLNSFIVRMPSLENEQKAIATILNTSNKETELFQQELELLKLQKKGLMQLLLTGIVRVEN